MFWIYVSHVDIYIPKHFAVSLYVISIETAVYNFWNSLLREYPFEIYISYSIFVFCLVKEFWEKKGFLYGANGTSSPVNPTWSSAISNSSQLRY